MNANKIFKGFVIGAVLVVLALTAAAQKNPRELGPAPELKFKLTKPVPFTAGNGIQCYYMEDKELPLVSLTGLFKGGALYEPAEKTGLAYMTGAVMRTGGTTKLTGDQINEELEFIAASVESNGGSEFMFVSGNSLKKDFAKLVDLYADIVMNPEFRQDKIDLARNQALESLRRQWDMPSGAASLLFREKLYGAGYALGRRMTYKSLNAITREDLLAFHQKFIAPNNFCLGITGDLSLEEAKAAIERIFKGWATKKVTLPEVSPLIEKADGTIYYAYRDTPQGNVYMGHLGITRLNPDEFKVEVMNEIMGGGGFTARLMKELRSNRGLTYGIYGGAFEGYGKERGAFQIASQLKAGKLVEALGVVKGIIKDMRDNPVTDEEITTAKNSLINSFVFRFEQKQQILSQYMNLKLQGYPDNYLETYIDNIKKVTKAGIQESAKKYMNPDRMIYVIVGDEKKFDKPLSTFGSVKAIDLNKIIAEERGDKK